MKVLFICYYFPPIIATGCNRSLAFAQNLEKVSSYKPLILSVNNAKDPWIKVGTNTTNDFEIVRTEEWNLAAFVDVLQGISSKIFSLFGKDLKINIFREFITIPDTQIAWFKTIQGIELAKSSDIIYVSCSPFSSAVSSCFIKYFSKKPLVVDFRDAWTLNPHIKHSSFHNFIIKYLEKFVISNCDALILNTEGALKLYCDEYPEHSKKFHYVANGYDSLTPVSKSKQPNDTFNIMHIGSFYGNRSPDLLLTALSELKDKSIKFTQIGGSFDSYESFKDKVDIEVIEMLPREKALELMQGADLLYLKQGTEAGVKSHIAVAAKTYEYLATGLPVLAEVPEGDNAEIIEKYCENYYLIKNDNLDEMKKLILQAYQERKEPKIKEEFKETFSRVNLTKRLSEIFDNVSSK
ncbi:MAG: glycosyltransferase [Proteobacteria bacterium]|nr:glycosyltransferase [Pseudomonadota bacterium]